MFYHDESQDRFHIRRLDIATGATTLLAGSGTQGFLDGVGGSAQFGLTFGVAIDPSGTFALVTVRASPAPPHIAPPCVSPSSHTLSAAPIPIATPHVAHRLGALRSDPSPLPCLPSQDQNNNRIRRVVMEDRCTDTNRDCTY